MKLIPSGIKELLHGAYKHAECSQHQLLYLFLEITRFCNLACRHCGSDCSSKNIACELTIESWIKLLKDIRRRCIPTPAVVLTGGEPILHPDFNLLIETLNNLQYRWGLVSNGYNFGKTILDTVLKHNISSITMSLDGTERNHNWLRGKPDSYTQVISALTLIAKSPIRYKDVVTCVNPHNIHELDRLAEILIQLGIPSWRLFRIFPSGRARENAELLLSISETKEMLQWIAKRKAALKNAGLDLNLSCEGWVPFSIDTTLRNQPFFCRAGVNIASILCDGTITGCANNSNLFFEGNVLKDNLAYIWQNGFEIFRKRPWIMESDCGKCQYMKACQGGSIHLWRENLIKPDFCYMDCFKQ